MSRKKRRLDKSFKIRNLLKKSIGKVKKNSNGNSTFALPQKELLCS